jgi:hypothetical protein
MDTALYPIPWYWNWSFGTGSDYDPNTPPTLVISFQNGSGTSCTSSDGDAGHFNPSSIMHILTTVGILIISKAISITIIELLTPL